MTKDDIIRMADQSGLKTGENLKKHDGYYYRSLGTPTNVRESDLLAFAALVAAAEREACAEICKPQERWDDPLTAYEIAQAIRARGQS